MKLITLIASHIDSNKRLHNFIKLLESINNQIDYYDELCVHISLSYDENINKNETVALLSIINKNHFDIYYQDISLKQFEHYKFLMDKIIECDENNTWILFSDDDDEWAENRLAAYHYMINCIPTENYDITTNICYTNESNKIASTYVGIYVDYCVKLKYLKIFFKSLTENQIKHKYCDCYLVKFLCNYGLNKLKRAFCATNNILYNWIKHSEKDLDYSKKNKINDWNDWNDWKDNLVNNLDLYIAQYSKSNIKDWINFCDIYCNYKISNGEFSEDVKKYIIKLYLENFENHIFNDKYLPIYE